MQPYLPRGNFAVGEVNNSRDSLDAIVADEGYITQWFTRDDGPYGYAGRGRDEANTGVPLVEWTREELDEADRSAREVVRAIRAGCVDVGSWRPTDLVAAALVGADILGTDESSESLTDILEADDAPAGGP